MIARTKGFGLVEIMMALAIGLVMSLALTQLFATSKSTYLSQNASATLQEDARFVLAKMVQEARGAGMFGCLGTVQDSSAGGRFTDAFNAPVQWDAGQKSLTLITTPVGADNPWHEWVVHTDCVSTAAAWSRGRAPPLAPGEIALPVQRHVYRLNERRNELTLDGQPLLSNVRAFSVLFGVADSTHEQGITRYTSQPDHSRIRSVRLTLTLFDPADRTQEQTFHVVAAIRNRLS